MALIDRFKSAWNAFNNRDRPEIQYQDHGYSSYTRPDRPKFSGGNEKSIVTAVYNRIALDCSAVRIMHAKLDDMDRYLYDIDSRLNSCLTLEANKDQSARAFIQDIVMSMFDEGVVAVVPIDTTFDPTKSTSYDIASMRTGSITQWYPDAIKVLVYDDREGRKKEIIMPKAAVAIIENPFYSVMNEPNSTLKRLIHKLALLDAVDESTSSGKLNMIIQLPYIVRTEERQRQAEKRSQAIEEQLTKSKLGIAYTDGTEKITQLGHPLENGLMEQIQYLIDLFYSQMGLTVEIMNGTADEQAMIAYNSRIIEPIINTIVSEYKRKFLTKTARTQKQSIVYFTDPFKLVPLSSIGNIASELTGAEIMSSNEFRQVLGLPPSSDPQADELRNKNINPNTGQEYANTANTENQNGTAVADEIDSEIDQLEGMLNE